MSSAVFWQSIWYLLSFYLTWPLYLALQITWISGTGYANYPLIVCACILVPLQGFWNSLVYFRTRVASISNSVASISNSITRLLHSSLSTRNTAMSNSRSGRAEVSAMASRAVKTNDTAHLGETTDKSLNPKNSGIIDIQAPQDQEESGVTESA